MGKCRQFDAAVISATVADLRVGTRDDFKSFARVCRSVTQLGKTLQVGEDVLFMLGMKDRLHVVEVLVERRSTDTRSWAIRDIVTDMGPCRVASLHVDSMIAAPYILAMRLDGLAPQPGHSLTQTLALSLRHARLSGL